MFATTRRLVAGCHTSTAYLPIRAPAHLATTLPRLLLRYHSSAATATATASKRQSKHDAAAWRGSPKRRGNRGKPHSVTLQMELGQLESLLGDNRSKGNRQTRKSNNKVQARKDNIVPLLSATPVPADDELPDWAQSHERKNMKPLLFDKVHHAFRHVIIGGSFKAEFESQQGKAGPQVCSVVAKAGGQEWKAVAEARTRDDARNTAILLMLAEMHTQGVEGDLFPIPPATTRYLEKHVKTHHLLDVFNYAASLGTVPSVACTRAERLKPGYHQYTISLPEQNLKVAAVAKSSTLAETAACLRFKKAAGKHVATSETGDLVAQNPEQLNSENAAKFLGWLANRHRHQNSADVHKVNGEGGGIWNAQVRFKFAGEQRSTPLIPSFSKAYAEEAATIYAAVSVAQDEPVLFRQFIEELIGGKGHLLEISRPIELDISSSSRYAMQAALGLPGLHRLAREQQDTADSQTPQISRHRIPSLTEEQKRLLSPRLKSSYERYLHSDRMADMRRLKSELPMNQYKSQVAEIVEDNVYSIIIGATGSGKTTQVPQIILEKYYQEGRGADCNIICTQPRRIAATSVAGRVADELGPDLKNRVGYHVRFDSRPPAQGGSVTYCTTGILLQQLQYEPDRVFDEVSHLMIDEVHERDKIIDFTLTVLKRAVTDRLARGLKVPRITLMSATLDTELFADYFKNLATDGKKAEAPVLSVPGRTFPVSEKHLDDVLSDIQGTWSGKELDLLRCDRNSTNYIELERKFAGTPSSRQPSQKRATDIVSAIDWAPKPVYDDAAASAKEDTILPSGLIATTIAHVLRTSTDGAVLVFFPGLTEIQAIEKIFKTQSVLGVELSDETKYKLFLLHSSIPDSQRTVFEKAPKGVRKVILSTNIAETSVTIPDVQYVIDTGKVRQVQYDNSTRVSWLQNSWVSKSNAKQRAGRAGRVQNGHYLALYSKARHEAMPAIGVPELLRSDLQSTCLSVRATIRGVGVTDFLADAIDPPNPASVKEALTRLVDLGALTPDHAHLTALGKLLASLPVHPALGKMIVLGIMFKCLDPVLVIGAAAEERGLFVMAPDVKAQSLQSKADFAGGTGSDHLAIYNAFCQVREYYTPENDGHARRVAYGANVHFGAWKAIQRASQQIQDILQEAGVLRQEGQFTRDLMIGGPEWNVNSHKPHIIKAILLAGLQPNIGLKKKTSHRLVMLGDRPAAEPSNFSVLRINRHALADESLVAFTSVSKSTDGRSFSLRELSIVRPLAVALFGGTLEARGHADQSNILIVNRWLQLFVRGGFSRHFGAGGHAQLADLRQNLDRVLKVAFEDLVNGQIRSKTTPNQPERREIRNSRISMNLWAGNPSNSTMLTASQKSRIVSDFLAAVVKVLDGAESPAAEEGAVAYNSSDENENNSSYSHAKKIWSGKPNRPERSSLSASRLSDGRRARTGSFRF